MTRRAKERRMERVYEKHRAADERAARDQALSSRPEWRQLLVAIDGPQSAVQLSNQQHQHNQQQEPSPPKPKSAAPPARNAIVNTLRWKSTHVPIAAASVFQLPIKIDALKGVLHYEFSTRDYDVNFSVQMICADGTMIELLEPQRCESQKHVIRGQLELVGPGMVLLLWDNSFSWLNAKQLAYSIELVQETPEASAERKTALAQRVRHERERALLANGTELARLETAVEAQTQSIEFLKHQIEALTLQLRESEAAKDATVALRESVQEQRETLVWEIRALNWRALDKPVLHGLFAYLTASDLTAWSLTSKLWAYKIQDFAAATESSKEETPEMAS